jgi:hypothetical protein
VDSLRTGRLHEVSVDLTAAEVQPGPGTTYELRVQESGSDEVYHNTLTWRRPGNDVFRGNGVLESDDALIPFIAPINLRTGPHGRFRAIVDGGDGEYSAVFRSTVAQVAAGTDDVEGPDIDLSFPGRRTTVRPGDPLTATLLDTSGVNILASNPANSILLEFDGSGIFTNVSTDVIFEPGSYSRATLTTALPPDLELGRHAVVMTASDMFGNVGRDTLSFELQAAATTALRDVTIFPNPTPGPCRLICDLSGPMNLQWDIYTVSGRRVRTVRESFAEGGPAVIDWDGRDGEGDEIANGVYLYVLRGESAGDSHGFRETGQLVIMR